MSDEPVMPLVVGPDQEAIRQGFRDRGYADNPAAAQLATDVACDERVRRAVERTRRECAEQLRDFAREHTGRRTFRDEDDNLDYIDRYASQESLYALAAEWADLEEET